MSIQACLEDFERRTVERPNHPDAWYNFGILLAHADEHERALTAVSRALEIHPHYVDAAVSRCFLLAALGRKPEACREFKRIHVRSPDDFTTLFALGVFCMRSGWKDIGLEQLLRAESQRPNLPYVILHAAGGLLDLGRSSDARDKLYKARAIVEGSGIDTLSPGIPVSLAGLERYRSWRDPFEARVHVLLASFASGQGNVAAAGTELLQANRTLPGHHLLMGHMGRHLIASGKHAEAERWLTAAIRMDGDSPQAYFELSFLFAESRDLDRAAEALRKAVALRPLFPDYHYHLGTLLLDGKQYEEAIEELKKVLLVQPGYCDTSIHLANAYIEKDAPDEAIAVLASSPCVGWPETLVLMARAHAKCGRRLEARSLLEKSLAADPEDDEARTLLEALKNCPVKVG